VISFLQSFIHEISAPQCPCVSLLSFFLLPAKQARFVTPSASDQTTSLEFGALSLIYSVLDELTVSPASNFFGFAKVEEGVMRDVGNL